MNSKPATDIAEGFRPVIFRHDGRISLGRDQITAHVGSMSDIAQTQDRDSLIGRAFRLEYLTLAWLVVEAAVPIWSGIAAHSVSLLAFGINSVIEFGTAGVLVWRLTVELRHGRDFAEAADRRASRTVGVLLLALAAFVVVSAVWKLWSHTGEAESWPGMIITLVSIPVTYALARRKLVVADALGSRALRADASENIACLSLAILVLAGLALEALTGLWWIDAVTSLGIVWFLLREGREAFMDRNE